MSMSICFQAIVPVDGDEYRKQKAVLDACVAADVTIPPETKEFFGEGREFTDEGVLVSIGPYSDCGAVEGDPMYGDGATIDISKLPLGTTIVRVYAE